MNTSSEVIEMDVKQVIHTMDKRGRITYITFLLEGEEERIDISPACDDGIHWLSYRHFLWDSEHKEWVDVTLTSKLKDLLETSVKTK